MSRIKGLTLVTGVVLTVALIAGCSRNTAATTTTTYQDVTVGRGTVSVSITTTGTMDYADYQNLSFSVDGTVGEVNVSVGDLVTKGQVLASLDADAWNTQIETLQKAVETAQQSLTTAQNNVTKAQRQVVSQQLSIAQAELDLQNAQINLQNAKNTLANISDVKKAQDAVDAIKNNIQIADSSRQAAGAQNDTAAVTYYTNYINGLNQQLVEANKVLKDVSTGVNVSSDIALQIQSANLQIASAELQIKMKQNALDLANATLNDNNTAVTTAQDNVTTAEQAITDAQQALDDAQAADIQIVAPFDGAITAVNVAAGVGLSASSSGVVKKGATAMVIADTSKFEANMLVNETDITSVTVGMLATVEASALPNEAFNARVTAISPVATTQSGVVNYAVTAVVVPVVASTTGSSSSGTSSGLTDQSAGTGSSTTTPSGRVPPTAGTTTVPGSSDTTTAPTTTTSTTPSFSGQGFGGNFNPGNLTQDQLNQFRSQFGQRQGAQSSVTASAYSQLRQGLSLTVNLVQQQRTNVIVVPNQAVKTQSGKSYVTVKAADGTTNDIEVTIGLKDYQYTEITNGLTEGQTVVITRTTSTSSSSSSTTQGGIGIPGIGGAFGR